MKAGALWPDGGRAWHYPGMSCPRFLLPFLACATAAAAQSPMGPDAFESYTAGRTLVFSADGHPYGAEQYGPDRHVRWSFLDGECRDGRWYAEGNRICFVYEDMPKPKCWTFFRSGSGLRAKFAGDPQGSVLYETDASGEPLTCFGPKVGV